MNVGMLWFDNDKGADLDAKVKRAADYYSKKYGKAPNLCFVNPGMVVKSGQMVAESVELRTSQSLLPNHFWMGVAEVEVECPAK